MGTEHRTLISEEQIRERSYTIWEADGRRDGRDDEYWMRARAELEAELTALACRVAEAPVETTDLVMPHIPISKTPFRREAERIDPNALREAA